MKKRKFHLLKFWVIDFLLLLLANLVFPNSFVLGNFRYGVLVAAAISALIWAIIIVVSKLVLTKIKLEIKDEIAKTFIYFLINFVALWLVARFAPYTGFGAKNFIWLLGLALAAEVVFLVKRQVLGKLHSKKK